MADTATVEQVNGTETATQEARTFTQDEVNAIVEGRLRKESAKYADYESLREKAQRFDEAEEAQKTELQKATEKAEALQARLDALTKESEVRTIREKIASETGVPIGLITADTEDACKEQAEAILAFAKPSYPTVRDGGEARGANSASTRDQFAEFVKSQLNR